MKFIYYLYILLLPLGLMARISEAANSPKNCLQVLVGSEVLFKGPMVNHLRGKKIGLITNHTAVNAAMCSTLDLLKEQAGQYNFTVTALFAPEHGLLGSDHAFENVGNSQTVDGIPIFGLFGKQQRPTSEMLEKIDFLIYDIQDIGSRSYTYVTTLFYAMEEAAKARIPVMVLDRPNPINGVMVDGPMLEDKWRSIVGYINVPYCHGMTVGELASFFNTEYSIGCDLKIVPMENWNRKMSFAETGLIWVPTSPNIPEATSPLYYPLTGILGELSIVSIGIGYTLPFKIVGAPWINAENFAKSLNKQKFPGVHFQPFYFKPFHGKYNREECQGVLIVVTDPLSYQPVATQYLLIGGLKSLYPIKFKEALEASQSRKEMFCKVNGNDEIYRIMSEEKNIVWKLRGYQQKERQRFLLKRRKYLLYSD